MASITTWTRLEPRTRTDDMAPSLEGRVYDSAWLLGRQWQVGEFVGDDAGSPIHAELQVVSRPFAAYRSGTANPIICGQVPFDALAGPELRGEMTRFESAEAGAQLMALLATYGCSAAGAADLVRKHSLPAPTPGTTDAQGTSYLGLLTDRLPDAVAVEPLARQAAANAAVPDALGIPASDGNAFLKAAKDWISWLDALYGDALVASTTAKAIEGSVSLPLSSIAGIAVGMSVSGPGIPAGTTVVEVSAASAALTQVVSAEVPQGSNISFGAGPLVVSTNADAPAGSITLPFASTVGIAVGMSVGGPNIPNGTTVAAPTASVTLSAAVSGDVLPGSNITFSPNGDAWVDASLDHKFTVGYSQVASTTAKATAGSVSLPLSSIAGIAVGMSASEPNIASGTAVVEVSAASVALTQAVSAIVPQGSNITFGPGLVVASTNADAPAGSITLPFDSTAWIVVGMSVSGPNIPSGTTVAALTPSVTLSVAVSGDVPPGRDITFSLAFVASAWDGERADWYDLDADPTLTAPTAPSPVPPLPGVDPATGLLTIAGPPAPLSYPGMPPRGWWHFDEGHVNFAQIAAAKDDLARMLVVEFASLYSNDWYLWPLRVPVASLNFVKTLNVTNTFGETIAIGPIGSAGGDFSAVSDWCLFRSTLRTQAHVSALNCLLLPAALADEQRSEPLEDVMFMRDEVAELAWAIERIVTGSDGRPLDRHSATVADPGQVPPPVASSSSDSTPLRYQLATDVPPYWFPLVRDPNKSLFNRLILRRLGSDGHPHDVQPSGTILRPGTPLAIRQEEVPREGAEVRRNHHSVRGVDGAVLLWCGRSKRAGRGEGSSGLRYDSAFG